MVTNKYTNRRYDVEDAASVDTEVLEHIPYDYLGSATDVTTRTVVFSSRRRHRLSNPRCGMFLGGMGARAS